jgi:hypothetical protein
MKPNNSGLSLREARQADKLAKFIAEREGQPPADQEAFEATINSMAGKSKSEPETSQPECDED